MLRRVRYFGIVEEVNIAHGWSPKGLTGFGLVVVRSIARIVKDLGDP